MFDTTLSTVYSTGQVLSFFHISGCLFFEKGELLITRFANHLLNDQKDAGLKPRQGNE